MYIRRVSTRSKISGESYFTHKVLSADTNEVRLYCHSPGREQKEVAIVARLTRRFEEGLAKLCQSIAKPRGERRLVKITERVGRLKQKCRGVAQHYRIEYQMDDAGKKFTALTWTKQPISGTQMSDQGVYCLRNILRELQSDVGVPTPSSGGDLSPWAHQGVLLLNTVLTVRAGEPASHAKQGWEHVTDAALTCCAKSAVDRGDAIVAMLWGAHARAKAPLLLKDEGHTLVLQAAHPSGLSANRGFFGCGHFSAANAHLVAKGGAAIDWRVGDGVPQTLQGD